MIRPSLYVTAALGIATIATLGGANARTESFRRSCSHIEVRPAPFGKGRLVSAICRRWHGDDAGLAVSIEVPPEGCDDIENRNGRLRCLRFSVARPDGSWRSTCRDGRYLQGGTFEAVCSTLGGLQSGLSRIDVGNCPRPRLANMNGRLRCE